jgi:glyoxylase-like metal-dependent hydrolase (beta-lactamase superfamily II)
LQPKVHHLNCGSFCPLMGSDSICHCLLLESARNGLVLVDTGIGHAVTRAPGERVHRSNRLLVRPRFDLEESALRQVQKLGHKPHDVRHIIVTHLDFDHAGGLQDFPEANVHVFGPELDAACVSSDPRYDRRLWQHNPRWRRYDVAGDDWFGFERVRPLHELDDEIALVPLVGHTLGHCGVGVRAGAHWLLHAGDCYVSPNELNVADRSGRPARSGWHTRLSTWLATVDVKKRDMNVRRLSELARNNDAHVKVFCSHSVTEFGRLRASQTAPA